VPADLPHILFLMTDQHRADCIGAHGNLAIGTPNIDRLAVEGVRFECAYSSTPSCTPARAALLTGRSPWRHGMLGYGRVAPRYAAEKPHLLRQAGYHTVGIGKMHFHPQQNHHGYHETVLDESGRVEAPGFTSDYRLWFQRRAPGTSPDATGIGWNDYAAAEYALPEDLHPTRWTGDAAVNLLRSYDRPEPLFLKVSFARPHSPYDPPSRFLRMYDGVDIPMPVVGDWAERNAMRGQTLPADTPRGDLGLDQARRSRQGYYGSVSFIDEQIGRILDVLDRRGWLDRSLILFTSDHGDMLGDHHLWRKTYGYEGSARVPMLVRWPEGFVDAPPGQVLRQPVELRDVLPTFLDVAGAAGDPERFDGRSLLGLVRDPAAPWRDCIDLEHSTCYWRENQWNGLADSRFKYIRYAVTGSEELFDLATDPGETREVSGHAAYQDILRVWRARLVGHLAERGEPYVVNGELGLRPEPMLYSPHYPAG